MVLFNFFSFLVQFFFLFLEQVRVVVHRVHLVRSVADVGVAWGRQGFSAHGGRGSKRCDHPTMVHCFGRVWSCLWLAELV